MASGVTVNVQCFAYAATLIWCSHMVATSYAEIKWSCIFFSDLFLTSKWNLEINAATQRYSNHCRCRNCWTPTISKRVIFQFEKLGQTSRRGLPPFMANTSYVCSTFFYLWSMVVDPWHDHINSWQDHWHSQWLWKHSQYCWEHPACAYELWSIFALLSCSSLLIPRVHHTGYYKSVSRCTPCGTRRRIQYLCIL